MSPARTLLLTAAALAIAAPAARADVFAAGEGRLFPRHELDIFLLNASTGTPAALPAGINTSTADELHPSISADGKRMVFERRSGATIRIVMVDLGTGQSVDLFSGFEQAANQQITPAISPDGHTVATGEAFTTTPQVTLTDVSAFPAGPFPHSTYRTSFSFTPGITGVTSNPVLSGNLISFQEAPLTAETRVVVGQLGGATSQPFGSRHPALANGTVLFDVPTANNTRDLAFRTFTTPESAGTATTVGLTQLDTATDQSRPSFSPDGRYVAFVNHVDGRSRLEVWDSLTQTTLSTLDLGDADTTLDGATTIFSRPLFKTTIVNPTQVRFDLLQSSGVGILVQRVTGHHKLFGKTVPTLKFAKRIPLGEFKSGKGHVRWSARGLKDGTYQVTVRAVDGKGRVRDLGKPRELKIHRGRVAA